MNYMSRKFSNSQVEAICIAVKQACDEAGTEAFLIGAQARDLWLYPKTSSRVTKDIDWVIGASDNDTYQRVHDFLVQKAGFQITNSNPFKLIDPNGIQLDLLPMVSEELAHFVGLQEILEFGSKKISVNDQDFRVATLPSIVLLKLVAWDNLPEYRTKDLEDIYLLLQEYFDADPDKIYENHLDLFNLFDQNQLQLLGARVLGREINKILKYSPEIKTQLLTILNQKEKMAQIIIRKTEETEDSNIIGLLNELEKGMREKIE